VEIVTHFRKFTHTKAFSATLALLAILLFNLILNPDFFSLTIKEGHLYGSLIDILNRSVPIMILAIGMTLVIATGGTDLSVGAVVALSAAVSVSLIRGDTAILNDLSAMPLGMVIIITLLIAMISGLWNGILIAFLDIQPIVATLVFMVAGRGIAQLITGARTLTTNYKPFSFIGQGWFLGLPVSVFIVLTVALLIGLVTKKTSFGMFVEAVGINRSASAYSGINSKLILILVYGLSGLCAGVSGLIVGSNIMCADANNAGLNFELDAILAVVIGGTAMTGGKFSLTGSIIGALVIQSLTTSIYSFDVPPEVTLVVKALVVVLVVLIQSDLFKQLVSKKRIAEGI
jgi:galactofuranose transport system permease protein